MLRWISTVLSMMLVLSGCAGLDGRTGSPDAGDASEACCEEGSYTLRADLRLHGQLGNELGRGAIRADLTGELTVDDGGAGTHVRSRVLAVREAHVDPGFLKQTGGPAPQTLRTVLLATDDFWAVDPGGRRLDASPLAPDLAARRSPTAFFHRVFTKYLGLPDALPRDGLAEGSSVKMSTRALHAGIAADVEDTVSLVRIERSGGSRVAEFAYTSKVRGADELRTGPQRAFIVLEAHESGVLRVDLDRRLPLQHSRTRTELLLRDGVEVVHNDLHIDVTYTPERR